MAAGSPEAELRAAAALVFVEDLDSPDISEDDVHHLGNVLRLKPGEPVAAADGAGAWRICAVTGLTATSRGRSRGDIVGGRSVGDVAGRGVGHHGLGLEVVGPVRHVQRPLPRLEVGFSWAKAERTEWAVAKLVELGLDLLTPLVADRTVVRPDPKGTARREARLRKIIREAAMQSRRPLLPEIAAAQSVDAVLDRSPTSGVALAEPGGGPISLATPIVLVGPEGGWSPRELALVDNRVSLGDGVLRVETAALAAGVLLTALRSAAVVSLS